jgi:cell division protein FtsZ
MPDVLQGDENLQSDSEIEIIKIVCVGGGGCDAFSGLVGSKAELIAADTDSAHLESLNFPTKILLGQKLAKGISADADPSAGALAAAESRDRIIAALDGADMIFIVAGMGGGTGTWASPVIAGAARETGATVVAVVTLPFSFEGRKRLANAAEGIAKLKEQADAVVVIPSDKLPSVSGEQADPAKAFELAGNVLRQAVHGVTDLILRPALINLDYADVNAIMRKAGRMVIGIGEGYGENRETAATNNAINSLLTEMPMTEVKRGLFIVTCDSKVEILEICKAAETIKNALDEDASMPWGQMFDADMEDMARVIIFASDSGWEK